MEHSQPKMLMSYIWLGGRGSNVLYVGWTVSSVSSSKKAKMLRKDVKSKKINKALVCVAFRKQKRLKMTWTQKLYLKSSWKQYNVKSNSFDFIVLINVYNCIIKMQILLDMTEEMYKMYKICTSTAFISQPNSVLQLVCCLDPVHVDLSGEIFGAGVLQVRKSAWEGGQMIDHHTAPVRGPVVFPWQIIPSFWWWWCFCV